MTVLFIYVSILLQRKHWLQEFFVRHDLNISYVCMWQAAGLNHTHVFYYGDFISTGIYIVDFISL